MNRAMRTSILLFLTLAVASASWAGEEYKVVVNSANPTSSVSRDQLSSLFLKKAPWPSGQPVQPVDLAEDSPVRRAFTSAVHGRPVTAVKAYWQQKVFSGRDVPPAEKASDAAVLAFVEANPGAIGYVSAATPIGRGVKEVTVN
jgi:ABC-type phosphate transport system substrate-binding protein